MDTNYKRRLGGTDNFLTTTTKGKRIEVKSDLLTKIYNNKIMKNLKTMIEDFQSEAKNRIAKGDFSIIEAKTSLAHGYFANIRISIDGVTFTFELSNDRTFVCDLSTFKIYPFKINESEFSMLEKAFKEYTKDNIEAEIANLERKIAKLRNNGS